MRGPYTRQVQWLVLSIHPDNPQTSPSLLRLLYAISNLYLWLFKIKKKTTKTLRKNKWTAHYKSQTMQFLSRILKTIESAIYNNPSCYLYRRKEPFLLRPSVSDGCLSFRMRLQYVLIVIVVTIRLRCKNYSNYDSVINKKNCARFIEQ